MIGDQAAPELALDAGGRLLPWPLSAIFGRLTGDRLAAVRHAATPNSYSSGPGAAQLAIAQSQAHYKAIMGGFGGLAGSEAEWDTDQGASTIGHLPATLEQDLNLPLPPWRLHPLTDIHPRDENTTRGYTGPVITPGKPLTRWGATTRFSAPRLIKGTLLPPEARTPTPREMSAAYTEQHPSELRLDDPFLTVDEGYF